MNILPSEIISHIFDFIGTNNFTNLSIVNREFDRNVKAQLKEHAVIKFSILKEKPLTEKNKYKNVLYDIDEPIYVNSLPCTIEKLYLGHKFNQPITELGILPFRLKELYFGKYFCNEIGENILPSTLQVLVFGKMFTGPLPSILPNTLTYLEVGRHYSYSLDNLPKHIQVVRDY